MCAAVFSGRPELRAQCSAARRDDDPGKMLDGPALRSSRRLLHCSEGAIMRDRQELMPVRRTGATSFEVGPENKQTKGHAAGGHRCGDQSRTCTRELNATRCNEQSFPDRTDLKLTQIMPGSRSRFHFMKRFCRTGRYHSRVPNSLKSLTKLTAKFRKILGRIDGKYVSNTTL
jgi:hypothetical protein